MARDDSGCGIERSALSRVGLVPLGCGNVRVYTRQLRLDRALSYRSLLLRPWQDNTACKVKQDLQETFGGVHRQTSDLLGELQVCVCTGISFEYETRDEKEHGP